jgi:hypothetical protein
MNVERLFVGKYVMVETLEVMLETLVVGKSLLVVRLRDDRDKGAYAHLGIDKGP